MRPASPDDMLYQIQQLVVDVSLINRNHFFPKSTRRENDVEHSMTVALLCWYVIDKQKLRLDKAKVLQYALAHDFVERYAGDVNSYATAKDRANKVENERKALERFSEEFATFPSLVGAMRAYEEKSDEEALFVWTIDKMQALVMDELSDWRAHAEIGVSFAAFQDKLQGQLENGSSFAHDVYKSVIEYSYTTFYDQPAHTD